ncbi:MAG: SDR family oxidoreductase [Candidatus Marinimicrobia bacterium]|jgi:NAD(P)-dependent dehydrogenase (short-subunit alcohol dehydrogenase family)|nr:SDR family oxidoreductase [Candidatus Neomarinimicrobiota bacterium]MBT3501075.1 SDR family oxidoreductase [Candidatus Neomarinimicrobiota bacterium]MBT3839754.1 SDR family oxidoreductase [Candidatus Neomarinimicrobiota bacterium]MBT3999033.1 SDR family oxidoreductase [Candidatus Neomarinimicrobiota bacterium]MBT4283172.1 SDR family oxidoreductase [Candidatus Neomarinimicrobiota bacterium]
MFIKNLLENKTIIITGGGTGLGKSMAMRFGELGANLVLTSRKQDVLDETAQEINEKTGAEILTVATDIRHSEQVEKMVDQSLNKFGSIDSLLNNAAGNFISPTENLSENAFRTIIDIVLVGSFNCTQAVGKSMRKSGGGTILNIVTTYAFTGSGYVVPSACAKAGVLAMTRSLAVEWAKYGIRTNAIAPGPFPTKGAWKRLVPPGLNIEKKMMERVPLKRFGEHNELANLASYLLADESGYMNGEVITMDGGEWLKGAGQFNDLERMPKMAWRAMDFARGRKKK